MKRVKIFVSGIVQGVGFRPYVYRLAKKYNICGFVKNTIDGVIIEAQGHDTSIEAFSSLIKEKPPALAKIKLFTVQPVSLKDEKVFRIEKSNGSKQYMIEIPPDFAICPECRKEILDEKDRRYHYPFTNCVNCGPRFTVIKRLPYDRKNTTMNEFKMCPECKEEYFDPESRRFHAQTNCCEKCGPQMFLVNGAGKVIAEKYSAIEYAGKLLQQGSIVAVKGIGGFHLACNAFSLHSVRKLRERKNREEKPFAVMVRSIETAKKYCKVTQEEEKYLTSSSAPIVLVEKIVNIDAFDVIAPDNKYLGIMLPYSGIHVLLFEAGLLEMLVMTSGNISDQPICFDNESAFRKLNNIADFFLMHDREIFSGCDDSVMRVLPDKSPLIIRRSRGFSPESMKIPFFAKKTIFACGGDMKNTFSFMKEHLLYTGHHMGDLDEPSTIDAYVRSVKKYANILKLEPEIVAYDAHPDYLSSGLATSDEFFKNAVRIPVFHHHAHICSCMVENGIEDEQVIGLAFDGTGYGQDGSLWGSEFLLCDYRTFQRLAHLRYVKLPGGEKAIKEIWRIAFSYLFDAFENDAFSISKKILKKIDDGKIEILKTMIEKNLNSPYSCGLGRFFDAVSCLCGLKMNVNYEGQAAIQLESAMKQNASSSGYDYEIKNEAGILIIDHRKIISSIVNDIINGTETGEISFKFHRTVVNFVIQVCKILREKTGVSKVVLSGGCFQNVFLSLHIKNELEKNGFIVYSHKTLPPNDACISAGQCAVANFLI